MTVMWRKMLTLSMIWLVLFVTYEIITSGFSCETTHWLSRKKVNASKHLSLLFSQDCFLWCPVLVITSSMKTPPPLLMLRNTAGRSTQTWPQCIMLRTWKSSKLFYMESWTFGLDCMLTLKHGGGLSLWLGGQSSLSSMLSPNPRRLDTGTGQLVNLMLVARHIEVVRQWP